MERLSYDEFVAQSDAFAESVRRTTGIASFCSGPAWQVAANEHLHSESPAKEHFIVREGDTWIVFVERANPRVYFPLEASWMFGCPLIGDPAEAVELLTRAARSLLEPPYGFCIGGVPENGRLHSLLLEKAATSRNFESFPTTDCMIIDLSNGPADWLSKRSKKFRKTIRQLRLPGDIEIVEGAELSPRALLARILAIQKQTYKWRDGTDIFQSPNYPEFYLSLLEQLMSRNAIRVLFAKRGKDDLAYILGGVDQSVYRGLQMSYIDSERNLGLGNLLQWENIRRRTDEGITVYDLGMHSDYKERWADRRDRYVGVFWVP